MSRPRQTRNTHQRLLDAGVAAFLEHGYHGTGLKQVLDRVDIPKGSFYNYFPSKEEFGAATIQHFADRVRRDMARDLEKAADPLAGLRRFFRNLMKRYEQADYVGGCLLANLGGELEGSEVCRGALADAFRGWRGDVRDALRRAQELGTVRDDIEAGELADMLVEAWEGAVIRMKVERSLKPLQRCLRRLLDDYFKP